MVRRTKQKLIAEFTRATSEYLRMESAQLRALVNGDGRQFDREIARARKERDQFRELIMLHQQNHGC